MNNQIFAYISDKSIETLTIGDEIWFKAKQVAEILEYKDANQAVRKNVDPEDKKNYGEVLKLIEYKGPVESTGPPLDLNQQREIWINEPGLYCLVLKSRKQEAQNFRKWVTHDVIPSIRKAGRYEDKERIKQLQNKVREMDKENNKLNKTIDWYMEHDTTKCTDPWQQSLPPKKMEYKPQKQVSENQKKMILKGIQRNMTPILNNPFDCILEYYD